MERLGGCGEGDLGAEVRYRDENYTANAVPTGEEGGHGGENSVDGGNVGHFQDAGDVWEERRWV